MNKDKYKSLASGIPSLPIFFQPWWLDAVVEKNSWDVVLIEEDGTIHACFVYVLKKKGPFKAIGMPSLTPSLGFWFAPGCDQNTTAVTLLGMLPKHDKFYMQMHHKVFNLELDPGFEKQELHTYVLNGIKDHESIYSNFKQRIKGEIKKAEGKITITETKDVLKLFHLCEKSYKRQNKNIEFNLDLVRGIYDLVTEKRCGTILLAEDEAGNAHAATLLVADKMAVYYLLNGGDPALRSSGANSLLMWEAIKHASKYVDTFDFEGSMIPGVEKYIQGYSPEKEHYALFTKTNSKLIAAAEGVKRVLRK